MNNSSSKAGEVDTISYSKEGAHIERAFTVVCLNVNVKVGSIIAETS